MNLWRLEILRLVRTYRWMILFGVYVFFGVLAPFTARYLNEIVSRFGGELMVAAPDPRPADGIGQFVSNASQLGLLAVVVVAAAALALDARPEVAAFLRTRTTRPRTLLVPRYVANAAAAALALVVGTAVAWVLTTVLIGPLPAGAMALGTVLGSLYLAFAVAVVAAVAGFVRSQAATVFGSLAILILLPLTGLVATVKPWLPSELLAAVAVLVDGGPASAFARSTATTLAATAALLAVAVSGFARREL
jgi:ABC-2 type transport system permease protein